MGGAVEAVREVREFLQFLRELFDGPGIPVDQRGGNYPYTQYAVDAEEVKQKLNEMLKRLDTEENDE